jgi:hypothetical protein
MSSPLAIGAVTAVLRNLLDSGMIENMPAADPIKVSAVAPDLIDLEDTQEGPRLNLFLHQVTPNLGWRNRDLPSRSSVTGERLTNAALAIDLHYIVTAYARVDCQAEILLGYAMHLLHERAIIDRSAVKRALQPDAIDISMLPPAFQALAVSDLADQVELLKITPETMSNDEMSKIWSAIQTHYRPSAAYTVSVVLIEGNKGGVSPLPVLSRGGPIDPTTKRDPGVLVNPDLLRSLPTLTEVVPPSKQISARLGETVTVNGVRLSGSGHVVLLDHRLLAEPFEITPSSPDASGTSLTFALPSDATGQSGLAPGLWSLKLRFTPAGETKERETNEVPLVIAPVPAIAADPALGLPAVDIARGGIPPRVTVTIFSKPEVRPQQKAQLMLDGVEAVASPRETAADPLEFGFPDSLLAGPHWLRLRVDGSDSRLVDRSGPAPAFDSTQKVTVPA